MEGDAPASRRAKLQQCLIIAREKGNKFLEANLLKALKELDREEKGG